MKLDEKNDILDQFVLKKMRCNREFKTVLNFEWVMTKSFLYFVFLLQSYFLVSVFIFNSHYLTSYTTKWLYMDGDGLICIYLFYYHFQNTWPI